MFFPDPMAGGDNASSLNLNHDSIRADPEFMEWRLPHPLETLKGYIVKLQYLEPLVDRYRSIVEEISKSEKYPPYLTGSQKSVISTVLHDFNVIDKECHLPDRPPLTDVAKAERHYNSQKGDGLLQGKRRLQKKTNKEAAIIREQNFFETVMENTKLWITIAETKIGFMTSIEQKIQQIHDIARMLDKKFNDRLQRLYLPPGSEQLYQHGDDDEEGDYNLSQINGESSKIEPDVINAVKKPPQNQNKRNRKHNKKRTSITSDANNTTDFVSKSKSKDKESRSITDKDYGEHNVSDVQIEGDVASMAFARRFRDRCAQTNLDFYDVEFKFSDEFEEVDDSIPLFEVCSYEY